MYIVQTFQKRSTGFWFDLYYVWDSVRNTLVEACVESYFAGEGEEMRGEEKLKCYLCGTEEDVEMDTNPFDELVHGDNTIYSICLKCWNISNEDI